MSAELISVIIPTYNSGKYIRKCIESVLDQSYKELEIVVVDGGSKDNTVDVIKSFASEIINIYITQPSTSNQRYFGLQKSKGSYVFFLDSDDYIDPMFFNNILSYSRDNKLDVVLPSFVLDIYDNNRFVASKNNHFQFKPYLINGDNFFNEGYKYGCATQCKLYKRNVIQNSKLFKNLIFGEDLLFNYSVSITHPFSYGCCKDALYHYRKQVNTSDTGKRLNKNSVKFFIYFLRIIKGLNKHTKNYQGAFDILVDNLRSFILAYLEMSKFIPLGLLKSRLYVFLHLNGKNRFFYLVPRIFVMTKRKS